MAGIPGCGVPALKSPRNSLSFLIDEDALIEDDLRSSHLSHEGLVGAHENLHLPAYILVDALEMHAKPSSIPGVKA